MGWGDIIGKVFDWIPGRREHYRNKIEEIKREMDKLANKGLTGSRSDKYERLSKQLRTLRQRVKNT